LSKGQNLLPDTCLKKMQETKEKLSFEQMPAALAEVLFRIKRIEALLSDGQIANDIQDEMLDINETSAFLKLSVSTLYSKVCRGEIPAIKPGRRLYFNRSELIDWLKQSRKKSTKELIHEYQADRGRIPFQRKRKVSRLF
jgi:excisionase family DNA binding protein